MKPFKYRGMQENEDSCGLGIVEEVYGSNLPSVQHFSGHFRLKASESKLEYPYYK